MCGAAQRGYDGSWLGNTFAKAVFLGNGLVAILAGLLAHALVEYGKLGPVAPFDAAAGVMLAGGVLVALTWTENYGDNSERRSFGAQLHAAGHAIARGAPQGRAPGACPLEAEGNMACSPCITFILLCGTGIRDAPH